MIRRRTPALALVLLLVAITSADLAEPLGRGGSCIVGRAVAAPARP